MPDAVKRRRAWSPGFPISDITRRGTIAERNLAECDVSISALSVSRAPWRARTGAAAGTTNHWTINLAAVSH